MHGEHPEHAGGECTLVVGARLGNVNDADERPQKERDHRDRLDADATASEHETRRGDFCDILVADTTFDEVFGDHGDGDGGAGDAETSEEHRLGRMAGLVAIAAVPNKRRADRNGNGRQQIDCRIALEPHVQNGEHRTQRHRRLTVGGTKQISTLHKCIVVNITIAIIAAVAARAAWT